MWLLPSRRASIGRGPDNLHGGAIDWSPRPAVIVLAYVHELVEWQAGDVTPTGRPGFFPSWSGGGYRFRRSLSRINSLMVHTCPYPRTAPRRHRTFCAWWHFKEKSPACVWAGLGSPPLDTLCCQGLSPDGVSAWVGPGGHTIRDSHSTFRGPLRFLRQLRAIATQGNGGRGDGGRKIYAPPHPARHAQKIVSSDKMLRTEVDVSLEGSLEVVYVFAS
jgi:hypothetical protein